MSSTLFEKRYGDFSGGESARQSLAKMDPRFSRYIENGYISELGVAKRPGYAPANATELTGVQLQSGYEFIAAGTKHNITNGGTKFYELKGTPADLAELTYASGSWVAAKPHFSTMKASPSIGSVTFTGSGLDDLSVRHAPFTNRSAISFRVQIDSTGGTVDTFKYSLDAGSTWHTALVPMIGDWQTLSYGVQIKFLANTGHAATERWDFTVTPAGFICIATGAGNVPLKIYENGADLDVATLGGSWPSGPTFSHVHKNRLWMNDPADPMLVLHSALADPEDSTSPENAGYLDLSTVISDQDEVIGAKTFVDLLVIFLKNHIVVYSGSDPTQHGDFVLRQVIEGVSAVDAATIQNLGDDIAFLDANGVKTLRQVVTTGDLNTKDLSREIDPALTKLLRGGVTVFDSVHVAKFGWYLLLTDTVVWCYHYSLKGRPITRFTGMDCQAFFATKAKEIYLCGNGYLHEFASGDVYSDNGANVGFRWRTAFFYLARNRFFNSKVLRMIQVQGSSALVTVDLFYDLKEWEKLHTFTYTVAAPGSLMDEPVSDIWDNVFYMDESGDSEVDIPLTGRGRCVQAEIYSSSSIGPMEFSEMTFFATAGGIR